MRTLTFVIEGTVNTEITVLELGDGSLQFDIQVLNNTGQIGDLRAIYFDIADDSLAGGLSVSGADVTDSRFFADDVNTVGQDTNINGEVIKEFGKFDAGIEFGTAGMSNDDIQTTSFVLAHDTADLTLDDINLQDFGIRMTSVGEEGGDRSDSLKLGGTASAAPDAIDDWFGTDEDTVLSGVNVLANDTDADPSDILSVVEINGDAASVGQPILVTSELGRVGELMIGANGSLTFDPLGGFQDLPDGCNDRLTVEYRAHDGNGGYDSASVSIDILGVNDAPVALDDFASTTASPGVLLGGAESLVNTHTAGDQRAFPHGSVLTTLENDTTVAIWTSNGQDGSGFGVYGQRYDAAGGTIGGEFQVNTSTTGNQGVPAVAALADGGFVVGWTDWTHSSGGGSNHGQRFDQDGVAVGTEFEISTGGFDKQISLAALTDGGFVAVWNFFPDSGSGSGVMGQRFDVNGDAVGGPFQINVHASADQHEPTVASLSDGGFIVTWTSEGQDGSGPGVFARRFDELGVGGVEFPVTSTTANEQSLARVLELDNGNALFVWKSEGQDGSGPGIYARIFDEMNAEVVGEFLVNEVTLDSQIAANVTSLSDGSFLITWTSRGQDGDGFGVFARQFDQGGNPLTGEIQLNQHVAGSQLYSHVTALQNGGFQATWDSLGQFSSDYDVVTRTFTQSGKGTSIDIDVLDNDYDIDTGSTLETCPPDEIGIGVFDQISELGATISLNEDGTLHYDPTTSDILMNLSDSESVTDSFAYRAEDNHGALSNAATVFIDVTGLEVPVV